MVLSLLTAIGILIMTLMTDQGSDSIGTNKQNAINAIAKD
jgi:hypothetical protein